MAASQYGAFIFSKVFAKVPGTCFWPTSVLVSMATGASISYASEDPARLVSSPQGRHSGKARLSASCLLAVQLTSLHLC